MMKQFYDLKAKHPDAVLLFRCGDFYEVYGDDAKVCAKVLGITLTFRDLGEHIDMAGFPHHALDTYLPKIIRAGHRVAICDQLEDPKLTKKLVRSVSDEQTTTATNNRINNHQTTESNMKLNLSNTKSKNQNVQNVQVTNTTIALQGSEYTVKDPKTGKGVTFESVVPATLAQPIEDAEFEEVPQSAPSNQNTSTTPSGLPHVRLSTYTTKRGDTAPQIIGFDGEDDPRWKSHKDAGRKWVSASYRRDLNGNKVYILLFGTRYMDVAKALAGAYNTADVNAWHRAEQACMAIYEQAQRDGKARWEEKKAQWAEKKAEKAAKKAADEQAKKCYTKEDVAAMLNAIISDEKADIPEDIKKLLAA